MVVLVQVWAKRNAKPAGSAILLLLFYFLMQVTLLLSKYILAKKESFFDPRNIKLALVKNDPLGHAFQVDAFHRCQVT